MTRPAAARDPAPDGQAGDLRRCLRQLGDRWNRDSRERYEQERQRGNRFISEPPLLADELVEQTVNQLESWSYRRTRRAIDLRPRWAWGIDLRRLLRPLLQQPQLSCLHFVRLMVMLREIDPATTSRPQRFRTIGPGFDTFLRLFRSGRKPPCDLRDLATAFTAAGLDETCLGWARLLADAKRPRLQLEHEATWPYFAERPGLLATALDLAAGNAAWDSRTRATVRRNALLISTMMPQPPATVVPALAGLALGASKAERRLAQAALGHTTEPLRLVQAGLTSGRWQQRAAAASWLVSLAGQQQVTVATATAMLEQALANEPSRQAREILQGCLGSLGPDPRPGGSQAGPDQP